MRAGMNSLKANQASLEGTGSGRVPFLLAEYLSERDGMVSVLISCSQRALSRRTSLDGHSRQLLTLLFGWVMNWGRVSVYACNGESIQVTL